MDAVTKVGEGGSVVNAIPPDPSLLWRIAFCDTFKKPHEKAKIYRIRLNVYTFQKFHHRTC